MATTQRATVLVVDDKRANQLALAAVLEAEYEMLFADSGAEAIALLETRRDVDIILMDVHMPEMDGFETAARIKKLPALQDIPLIFVTAVYQDDPFVKKGYEVGGIDYFSKPFDPEILKMKNHGSPLARAIRLGESSHSEPLEIRCFDGSAKTILASAAPLRGLDGQTIGAVVLIRDVTESKKIEEDLEQRVTRLVGLGVELEESTAP